MRAVAALAFVGLLACGAHAADPKVDAAANVFRSTASDPAKVKTFCEMSKVMDNAGDQPNAATDNKIQSYMTQLGPDFEQAWNVGSDLDENSEDGKTFMAALDELWGKCG